MKFVDLFIEMLQKCGITYGKILLFTIELRIEHGEQTFGRFDRWVMVSGHVGTQRSQLAQLKQGIQIYPCHHHDDDQGGQNDPPEDR